MFIPGESVDCEGEHSTEPSRAFLREYWDWVAVALFLLVTVDMLATMFAAATLGAHAEANPLMRWALRRGTPTLAVVNVIAVVLAAVSFYGLREMLSRAPDRYRRPFSLLVEAWLGLLVVRPGRVREQPLGGRPGCLVRLRRASDGPDGIVSGRRA